MNTIHRVFASLGPALVACAAVGADVETWRATELAFEAGTDYDVTGADAVTFDAVFTHESGEKVSRPGFWDGGKTFRVRFAPTKPGARAMARSAASPARWRQSPMQATSRSTGAGS